IQRSFKEERVSGYFEFKDGQGRLRKRFSARAHVPGTPFIASAAVNLDDFFEPAQERIRAACREVLARSQENIRRNHEGTRRRLTLVGLGMGAVMALAGVGVGLVFARGLSRPVAALAEGVRQVGEGNFAVAVPETGVKEVVGLAQEFNRLGRQLTEYIEKRDFIRDTFGRYVTREVVKKLLEDRDALELGGEIREVSILMNDLRGFTALTASMPPQQVITFLNRYLGKMIEVLLEHRAVIDEIMGDGILAFFGAPEPMEDHPARAVACALALQLAMDEVNAANAQDGIPFLEMGVAVNTGAVVVGNIGSERRTKYSVVGSHVNFTSRIEAMATGGQVLISEATYERVKDLAEVREVVQGQFKGVPDTVSLYNIKGIWGPYHRALRDRDEVLHPLLAELPVRFRKLKDKVAVGEEVPAVLTHLSDIGGALVSPEPLLAWEDIIVMLLDAENNDLPGRIYAKITVAKEAPPGRTEARLRFTSAPPDLQQILQDLPRRT
ncbi:MAG: HAMP domain-containing protein, partial [Deltaproteobacteria bacterium]|nr:HAMP domain-containing protein [Deltaproteobacteria bacterium]